MEAFGAGPRVMGQAKACHAVTSAPVTACPGRTDGRCKGLHIPVSGAYIIGFDTTGCGGC